MHPSLSAFPSLVALMALSAFSPIAAFGQSSDPDHYLKTLAETQNFSLGRPVEAKPTADGKSVIFLRSDSPRERTTGLYRFDVASGQTEELATPAKLLGDQSGHLSPEEKMRRERTRTKVTGITSFELSDDGDQITFSLPGALFVYRLGPLTITVETRDQHELALLEANPETGVTWTILKEDDPDWVNIDQSVPAWLADQGYVVVSFDGRGTPGRGRDWERAIYQKFGEIPLADQVSALTDLAARHSEMDLKRVGITGWSFGGYMSALAVLRRPEIFKAAVAGAPVSDWLDYDTQYTERYLGLPGDAIYAASSLIGDAPKLSRPLLLIHGTADDNVYFRHSLKLMDALEKAGRPFQFLPIVGSTHMVLDPGLRAQIEKRTVEFFKASL
jgi:dienelactone hydrolase